MLDEIYKEYGPYFYVPMNQAYSVAVPVTVGCTWNKCLYCDLNHDMAFEFLGLEKIEEKLKMLNQYYSQKRGVVKKIVLAGGNPFCLSTNLLLKVIALIKVYFPNTESVGSFSRADDILRKSHKELVQLRNVGLTELTLGLESGNDKILEFHNKGVTVENNYDALKKLEQAHIGYSFYVMLGLGGRMLSCENAVNTGKFISQFNPNVIVVVTLVLFKHAKLVSKVRSKEFERIRPYESLLEEKLMLENINVKNSIFNATHKTNAMILKGKLPEHKELLIEKIDKAILEYNNVQDTGRETKKWHRWSIE